MKPSKNPLDFKQFKKTHEDDLSATLLHPGGHKITIAKKALSKGMQKELSGIPLYAAEGTETPVSDPNTEATPLPILQQFYNEEALAHGVPERFRIGPNGESPQEIDPLSLHIAQQRLQSQNQKEVASQQAQAEGARSQNQGREALGLAPTPMETPPGEGASLGTTAGEQRIEGPATAPPSGAPNVLGNLSQGLTGIFDQQIRAEKNYAKAAGDTATQESNIYGNEAQANQKLLEDFQANHSRLTQDYQNMVHDVQNGHINPNHYLENQSVPGKVSSAIGLILGGIGSGITGGENPAMKFLQSQIDRDIKAQEVELSKKQGLVNTSQNAIRMNRETTDALRLMKVAGYEAQIKQAAAKLGGPQAQLAASRAITELQRSAMPIILGMNIRNALENNPQANMGQALSLYRQINPEAAKEFEGRLIPGVGVAQVPVDAKVRSEIVMRKDLSNKIQDLELFAQKHSGSLNPEIINQGAAKARLLQDAYRQANGQGVFREAEKEFVGSIADEDPTKFFAKFRTIPKYRELGKANRDTLSSLYQSLGIQGGNSSSPQSSMPKSWKPSE